MQTLIMLLNFRFLKCSPTEGRIKCNGERNKQDRHLTIDKLKMDGKNLSGTDLNNIFKRVGCQFKITDADNELDCFSI